MVETLGSILLNQALTATVNGIRDGFRAEETGATCAGDVVLEAAKPAMFRNGICLDQSRAYGAREIPRQSLTNMWVRTDAEGFFKWSCDGAGQRDRLQADQGLNNPTTRSSWANMDMLMQVHRDSGKAMQFTAIMVCPQGQAPTQFSRLSAAVPAACAATENYGNVYEAMRASYTAVMGDN